MRGRPFASSGPTALILSVAFAGCIFGFNPSYSLGVYPVDGPHVYPGETFTILDPKEVERVHPALVFAFRRAATGEFHSTSVGNDDGALEAFQYLSAQRYGYGPWLFGFEGRYYEVGLTISD